MRYEVRKDMLRMQPTTYGMHPYDIRLSSQLTKYKLHVG